MCWISINVPRCPDIEVRYSGPSPVLRTCHVQNTHFALNDGQMLYDSNSTGLASLRHASSHTTFLSRRGLDAF